MSAARDDVFVKEKEILVGVSLLFSSIWPKKSLKNGVQNVRGSDRMLSLFFSCTDKQDFVHCGMSPLLPSPFQNDKIPMRENPIFPSGLGVGNIGFSMGQKFHFDFMSGGDGQGRVLWLCGWR